MGRKVPFLLSPQASAVQASFTRMLSDICEKGRGRYIDPENVEKYHHGQSWVAHYASDPEGATTMMEISHQLEIPMRRVIDGDFRLFEEYMHLLAEKFHTSFVRNLYQTVSNSAERVGNTVSAEGKTYADAFLETLGKIDFGVDRDGKVSLPQFHVPASTGDKIVHHLEAQGQDFKDKVDKLKEEKSKAALQQEAERKARFKR